MQHACIGLVYEVKKTRFLCDCGGTIKNENGFYSFGVIYFMCFTISFAVIFFRLIPGECTDNIKRIKRHFVILCFAATETDKNNNITTNNEKEKLAMPCKYKYANAFATKRWCHWHFCWATLLSEFPTFSGNKQANMKFFVAGVIWNLIKFGLCGGDNISFSRRVDMKSSKHQIEHLKLRLQFFISSSIQTNSTK